jgi:hypothetical protein
MTSSRSVPYEKPISGFRELKRLFGKRHGIEIL